MGISQEKYKQEKMLRVRAAKDTEILWINRCYDDVDFIHSNFDKEIIAISEIEGSKAGIGRLVRIDSDHFELGGMYVFESFRKHGVASAIVEFLLKSAPLNKTIYCIPFEHLVSFYKKFGFKLCINLDPVPKELLDKYLWCKEKYPHPTALLVMNT